MVLFDGCSKLFYAFWVVLFVLLVVLFEFSFSRVFHVFVRLVFVFIFMFVFWVISYIGLWYLFEGFSKFSMLFG